MGRGGPALLQRGLDETTDDAGAVDGDTGDPGSDCVAEAELMTEPIEFPPLDGALPSRAG